MVLGLNHLESFWGQGHFSCLEESSWETGIVTHSDTAACTPMELGEQRGGHDSALGGEEGFLEEEELDLTG